ncbi:PREDICTED: uncharacterized protein LOC109179734 [Ipomoea nil]|uniref:uncharacterized protein LOC109179734 n=1 Tax=Ipomoea nil TaxID=35883 RepID=UPI000901E36E|nr:PREDICTED: uncharacterized protein LOC109179734 [Ipomoea nil]
MMVFKIVVFLLLITTFCNGKVKKNKPIFGHNNSNLHTNHSVTTIQSEDGDIIECINIYKQPAFKHPALRNHKIQMTPSHNHQTTEQPRRASFTKQRKEGLPLTITTQSWHRSGSCPRGTVPIRRKNGVEIRKKPTIFRRDKGSDGDEKLSVLHQNHSLAILLTYGYRYLGAKGDFRVHTPHVEADDEYSTSRVALSDGGPSSDYEEIQSGWAVNPSVYGDRQTRIFTYWTVDASKNTGCFDHTCPGFVQTSHEIALGAAIYPISSPTGLPYEISIYIHQDPYTRNWWVQYGEKNIGYWPPELFVSLKYHAKTVEWGGEVYSSYVGDRRPHTATAMGSGRYPDMIFGTSGYVKRMRILGNSMELIPPTWAYPWTDEYRCYDIFYLDDYTDDPIFYFGGPGRNVSCP